MTTNLRRTVRRLAALAILAIAACLPGAARAQGFILVDTNFAVIWPPQFWEVNRSAIEAALTNKLGTDTDLVALAGLSGTGILARTGDGTAAVRTLTGDSEIVVANGSGAAGNPTLSIGAAIARVATMAATYQPIATILSRLSGIGLGASGDVLIRDATGWTNLAKGTDGKVLKLSGGLPAWGDDATGENGGGTGDVVGPASATDSVLALFNGRTGKLIKAGTLTESLLATDAEVAAAYQQLDADLTDLADGTLTGSKIGSGIDGGNITAGTVADARIDAAIARLASPAFSGTPTAPTAAAASSNGVVASTAYVDRAVVAVGGGGNVHSASNNVFAATNYMLQSLVVSNGAARPAVYVYGTNSTGGSMQGGYLQSTEYASAAQNNLELSTVSNATASANSNIRLTVSGWRTADGQTNVHIGFNMGGTAYSSVTAKRDPAGDGFLSVRGSAMASASDLTEEGHVRMQSTGLSVETMKGGLALAPITGVTRLPGAASLTAPSAGEGLEMSYDNDETGYGGAGLGTLIAFDRSTTTWGAMRIRGTNVVIGSAAASSLATAELIVSNSVVLVQANAIRLSSMSGPLIRSGSGTPESAVTAPVGSIYLRTDGGASTTLYVKESGTGNTGWVAK